MNRDIKTELTWGVIIGIVTILWMTFEYILGTTLGRPDLGTYTGFFSVIIPILGLSFGLRQKRKELGGKLTFGEGVKAGLIISVISAVIASLFVFIFLSFFPQVTDSFLEYARQLIIESGGTEETASATIEQLRAQFQPLPQAIYMFFGTVITGTIISLIVSAFIKTKRKEPEQKIDIS